MTCPDCNGMGQVDRLVVKLEHQTCQPCGGRGALPSSAEEEPSFVQRAYEAKAFEIVQEVGEEYPDATDTFIEEESIRRMDRVSRETILEEYTEPPSRLRPLE